MRARYAAAAIFIAGSLPLVALAQTSGPTLSSLLSELDQLEQEIAALGGSSSATSSAPASMSTNNAVMCPTLPRSLSIGASGADVTSLQTFLSQEGYFQTSPTGYFGSVTQAAVGAWQEAQGVVSGASDPGFGIVGPKTRAAIAAACGGTVQQTECSPTAAPATECSTGWQPVSDAAGCTVYYQCTITLPLASTTTITTAPSATQPAIATTSCPFVEPPTCTGTVTPFQTDSDGCVTAYECVLQ